MNESPNDRMKDIWKCQPVEGMQMSADEIRKRAGRFERKILWRNAGEYLGGSIAALTFAFAFARSHEILFRIAFGMLIAALAYIAYQLNKRGSASGLPAEMTGTSCLQFHRAQLERQRDLSRTVWSWYLGPLVPGWIVLMVAFALADPHPRNFVVLVLLNLFAAALFIFIWKLNARATRSLQRLIDELYAIENSC